MVNFGVLKNAIGFGFKGFGFFGGLFDRLLCDWLCIRGSCVGESKLTCSLLFLFVAIIFIICGYAIITMPKRKRQKVKKIVETDISKDIDK